MNETHYLSHDVLLKKPIEKLHRHDRFNHLLKRILRENITINGGKKKTIDSDILDHILVEVYNTQTGVVTNIQTSWRDIVKTYKHQLSMKEWFLALPVLEHKIKLVTTDQMLNVGDKNSLNEGVYQRVYAHVIRLKFLPVAYTEHPFYKTGLINHLIYDMVMTSSDPDPKTVIGTEAYSKIEKLCASQTPGDEISNQITFYKNRYGVELKKNLISETTNLIEYIFSRLCSFPVHIYPSIQKKSEISWYIIAKKRA